MTNRVENEVGEYITERDETTEFEEYTDVIRTMKGEIIKELVDWV